MTRIFAAELFHEGHSFSALKTDREAFATVSGNALIQKVRESSSILGGAVRRLEAAGAAVVPGLSAVAPPGGAVRDEVYDAQKERILAMASEAEADAVFLSLHGAMLTESLADPEGDLLSALRRALGARVPIAVALDLHAHLTPLMLEQADICLACKENPHLDFPVAGANAADLLLAMLQDRIRPVTAAVWLPLVIGAQMDTGSGPLRELHDLRRSLAKRYGLLDISIYNTTAYLDAQGAGQCVTAIANGDAAAASEAAHQVAKAFWERREAFASDRPALVEVVADHLVNPRPRRPLIVGDQGDRVLAGAPGDDPVAIATLATQWPELRVLAPVTDPKAVGRARALGVGNTFVGDVGALYSASAQALTRRWTVAQLGDGRFVQKGPFFAGETAEMGPSAVLTAGPLTILATSRPGMTQDTNAFLHLGLRFEDYDVVLVKSGFHFRLSFQDVGPCVVADTPGLTNYAPGRFAYAHRRPVYPEELGVVAELAPRLFSPSSCKRDSMFRDVSAEKDTRSRAAFAAAKAVFPDGTSRATIERSPYPRYMQRGEGAYLTDLDGRRFLDLNNNFTTLIHGHAFPPVMEAMQRQLHDGTCFANPTESEIALAAILCERVPRIEHIRFVNTGTEAVMFAVKAARALTGRPKIAKIEGAYHGGYDWVEVSQYTHPDVWGMPESPTAVGFYRGVPQSVLDEVVVLRFNDAAGAERLIAENAASLACLVIDPMPSRAGLIPPTPDFVEVLTRTCRQHGVLIVSDEVLNFRQSYEGAAHRHGITADLFALGKIIGGGMPIGAVGGRAEVMQVFDASGGRPAVPQGGTFSANPLSMVAGAASMAALDHAVFDRLEQLGERVREEIGAAAARKGAPFCVTGIGSLFRIHPAATPPCDFRQAFAPVVAAQVMAQLSDSFLEQDILLPKGAAACLSTPMGESEADAIIAAFERFLETHADAIAGLGDAAA
ncbi:aminotransferase class III-fold pyridoxal phosphate-dependent enzyme [Pelagibius sp.]|uniref:aminotransferase class III-fold pyridoxal phosphate-dependent enzyme n=1 Tax=Pelagibius sp. TaxID=1931238 RepID=UPI003BB04FA5